jgi:hypothetical protein
VTSLLSATTANVTSCKQFIEKNYESYTARREGSTK